MTTLKAAMKYSTNATTAKLNKGSEWQGSTHRRKAGLRLGEQRPEDTYLLPYFALLDLFFLYFS